MINVSKEFQLLMNDRTDFKENAEITFADNTFLELSEKDFTVSNNSIVDAGESNGIPLGVALCRSIQIELMNDDDRFSQYDFFGAVIRLYLTFQLSETVERIEYGTFTVLAPETYGTTIIVTALDDMHKADKEYTTNLVFPATIGSMLIDACTTLGISLGTTTFLNDSFIVNEKPSGITFRQLFGYIAMIAGGNARIDRTGRLRIYTYDFSNMESIYNSVLNGGSYNPWDNPVNVDGGSFAPWDVGDSVDGGEFGDRNHFHVLGNWSNLKVDTDDVVITGVKTNYYDEENNEQSVIYGADGYVLLIDNPLIAGKEQSAVDLIGNVMVGGRFRQFSGDLVSNPTCEFMDTAILLDRKGNVYISFITDINFQFFGFTSLKNSADPTLRNSAKAYSDATKTLIKAKELISKERTARELAIEQLARDLSNSSGLYVTTEKQLDGSTIYYMHDKPTLAESMIVWKLTSLAFGISTDGGETYPYGFTVDGETITRLLYADGIDVKNLVVGENVQMGPNAKISWDNVTNQPIIPTNTNQLENGAGYTTMSAVEAKGYQNAIQVTQITKDTVTAPFVKTLGLTVGNEILMGDNATISWANVTNQPTIPTDTNQLANSAGYTTMTDVEGKGYQTASQVTQITKDTVTTSFVNALNVKAGSVDAENITGEKILGKQFVSNVINNLSAGYVTTIDGHIIKSTYMDGSTEIKGATIEVGSTLVYTKIEKAEIESHLGTSDYTTISGKTITSDGGTTYGKVEIAGSTVSFSSLKTAYLKHGSTTAIELSANTTKLSNSNVYLGALGGKLAFFGASTGSAKQSVTAITSTSTATASTVATKLNELLTALKAYNLIG